MYNSSFSVPVRSGTLFYTKLTPRFAGHAMRYNYWNPWHCKFLLHTFLSYRTVPTRIFMFFVLAANCCSMFKGAMY
jgi:hypothetical protein